MAQDPPLITVDYREVLEQMAWSAGMGLRSLESADPRTSANRKLIDSLILAGARQAYYPPALPGDSMAHRWSFMRILNLALLWPNITAKMLGQPVYDAATAQSTCRFPVTANYLWVRSMIWEPPVLRVTFVHTDRGYTLISIPGGSGWSIVIGGNATIESASEPIRITLTDAVADADQVTIRSPSVADWTQSSYGIVPATDDCTITVGPAGVVVGPYEIASVRPDALALKTPIGGSGGPISLQVQRSPVVSLVASTAIQPPVDFGGIVAESVYLEDETGRGRPVKYYPQMRLWDAMVADGSFRTGPPEMMSLQAVERGMRQQDGAEGQIRLFRIWPNPDRYYRLQYVYDIVPRMLALTSTNYWGELPMGHAPFAAAFLDSCLSMVELRIKKARGPAFEQFFNVSLPAAISHDRAMTPPWSYGKNVDPSVYDPVQPATYNTGIVSVNGVLP